MLVTLDLSSNRYQRDTPYIKQDFDCKRHLESGNWETEAVKKCIVALYLISF